MAEKHKSKYKKPENAKHTPRKDLKDYTLDNKDCMNPHSTKEKQANVLRKTDKEVIDNGSQFHKYADADHLYKDLESGEYDPKHAAKVFKKRLDAEEKDVKDVLADKLENLTREQREAVTRKYIQQQLKKYIFEQGDTTATEEPELEAVPEPVETPVPTETPAPAEPVNVDKAETTTELDSAVKSASDILANPDASTHDLVKATNIILNTMTKDLEPGQKSNFFNLMKLYSIKQLGKFGK